MYYNLNSHFYMYLPKYFLTLYKMTIGDSLKTSEQYTEEKKYKKKIKFENDNYND